MIVVGVASSDCIPSFFRSCFLSLDCMIRLRKRVHQCWNFIWTFIRVGERLAAGGVQNSENIRETTHLT